MKRGTPKFDGIAVGELTVNFLSPSGPAVKAKAAFVDSKTGHTHGWTECVQWSKETITRLEQLRAQMEVDLARRHMQDSETFAGETGVSLGAPGGLGEHLAGDETPQI